MYHLFHCWARKGCLHTTRFTVGLGKKRNETRSNPSEQGEEEGMMPVLTPQNREKGRNMARSSLSEQGERGEWTILASQNREEKEENGPF